jgi:hypothetical protein
VADIFVTGFLPEGWKDFAVLLETIIEDGARLWRWEEHSYEDGKRRRVAHVVQTQGGPKIEVIRATSVARVQMDGWRFARLDGDGGASVFTREERELSVGTAPLPPRVTIDLHDRVARRGAAEYPAILDPFRLAAAAGAAMLERVERFAELDLETLDRFAAPTEIARTRGSYDAAALCRSLLGAGYVEDGDAWMKDEGHKTIEVRLKDGAVEIRVAPQTR